MLVGLSKSILIPCCRIPFQNIISTSFYYEKLCVSSYRFQVSWTFCGHKVCDQVRDHLRNLNINKSMGPEEMHSSPDGIGSCRCQDTLCKKLWQSGEVPGD